MPRIADAVAATVQGVCFLATDLDRQSLGGVARNTFALIEEFARRGVEVCLCTRNYARLPRRGFYGAAAVQRSPVVDRSHALTALLYHLDTVSWLLRNRARYDVVHCQQLSGPAAAGVVAGLVTRRPVLVRVTSSGPFGEIWEVRARPFARLRTLLLSRVDHWVALTQPMKEELISIGILPHRISVIANGTTIPQHRAYLSTQRNRLRHALGFGSEPLAVYSGRLSSEKGLDVLLTSWATVQQELPSARLVLLGEGGAYRNVEGELRAQAERLRLQRVEFRGHVANVMDYLLAVDAFVLPSRSEGMSNALVEAMAAGLAIVATDIPANRAVLSNDTDGILVPPDDSEALGNAIYRILARPELAERLGLAARRLAESHHSTQAMADAYLTRYGILARRRRSS